VAPWGHIDATWRIRLNLCFLRPTRCHNASAKSIGSAVFAQLTTESPYTLQYVPLAPKIAPFHGDLDPHLTHNFLGPSESITQTASRSVQPFLHRWPHSVPILCNGMPLFPQNLISPWGDLDPYNTWFSGPTRVLKPNGTSIGSAVFAGLTSVADRQTDKPRYSVCNNRPHLSLPTAMRPNNNNHCRRRRRQKKNRET